MLNLPKIIHYVKWKEIPNFSGYFVSNTGLFRVGKTISKPLINEGNGRPYAVLTRKSQKRKDGTIENGARHHYDIHRLVWDAFGSEPRKSGFDIHHLDYNMHNNHIDNMELRPESDHMRDHGKINNNLHKNKKKAA